MRRILLGGLGLALSVFATPATAQDSRPGASPPQRAARLGQPVAIPESSSTSSPSDAGVTPAGLLRRPVEVMLPSPAAPPLTGGYVGGIPANGIPVGVPDGGIPVGVPSAGPTSPTWRPAGSTPMVTEDRGGTTPRGRLPDHRSDDRPGGVGGCCRTWTPALRLRADGDARGGPRGRVRPVERVGRVPDVVEPRADARARHNQFAEFNGRVGVGDTRRSTAVWPDVHSGFRISGVRWFGDAPVAGSTRGCSSSGRRPVRSPRPAGSSRCWHGRSSARTPERRSLSDAGDLGDEPHLRRRERAAGEHGLGRRELPALPVRQRVRPGDALVGYRFLNVNEKLSITENLVRTR